MEKRVIYITGSHSCALLRMLRRVDGLVAEPSTDSRILPLDEGIHTAADLHADALMEKLGVTDAHPLNVLVPDDASRRWSNSLRTKVLSVQLPPNAFLELRQVPSARNRIPIPDDLRVLVEAPALSVVQGARGFERLIACGQMSKLAATLKLMEFADEWCGAYSRDPKHPRSGKTHYDKPGKSTRLSTSNELRSFIGETRGVDGLGLARAAVRYVIDGAGSAMEAYVNHGFTLPPRLGGLSMRAPLVNQQLVVSDAVRKMLKHGSIRPDLQWPDLYMLAEYLGDKEHAGKPERIEDKDRMQDYAIAQYTAYPLMYDDVKSAAAFSKTAQMFAREMMRRGVKNELYRVRRILRDEDFKYRQATLVATLLPPVTHYTDV